MISTQKCYGVKQSKPATAALASLSFTLVMYVPRKDFRDLKGSVVAGCAQHSHLSHYQVEESLFSPVGLA